MKSSRGKIRRSRTFSTDLETSVFLRPPDAADEFRRRESNILYSHAHTHRRDNLKSLNVDCPSVINLWFIEEQVSECRT